MIYHEKEIEPDPYAVGNWEDDVVSSARALRIALLIVAAFVGAAFIHFLRS